mgnify:FL=1
MCCLALLSRGEEVSVVNMNKGRGDYVRNKGDRGKFEIN